MLSHSFSIIFINRSECYCVVDPAGNTLTNDLLEKHSEKNAIRLKRGWSKPNRGKLAACSWQVLAWHQIVRIQPLQKAAATEAPPSGNPCRDRPSWAEVARHVGMISKFPFPKYSHPSKEHMLRFMVTYAYLYTMVLYINYILCIAIVPVLEWLPPQFQDLLYPLEDQAQ